MKRVWLITVGEPSPLEKDRLHRTGLLSEYLEGAGFEVTLFNSTFYHQKKRQRFKETQLIDLSKNRKLVFLYGRSYRKNISLNRVISNYDNVKAFKSIANSLKKPDCIIVAFPILGLVKEAVKFGKKNNVKVCIDIRDFWPDVFYGIFPKKFQFLVKPLFFKFNKSLSYSFMSADILLSPFQSTKQWLTKYLELKKLNSSFLSIPFSYQRSFYMLDDIPSDLRSLFNGSHKYSQFNFVLAGTISQNTNIEDLLIFSKILQERAVEHKIIICGDGPYLQDYKKLANNNPNIVFTGLLGKEELSFVLDNSTFGLLPYKAEHLVQGIPNKAIEYSSFGLPLIVNKEMHFTHDPDYLNCIIKYNSGEIGKLVDEIVSLDSNKIKQMSYFAEELFINNFSPKKIYSQYHDLVKKLT